MLLILKRLGLVSSKAWITTAVSSASVVILCLTAFIFSTKAYAWGQNGHRIVGQIAFNHLTPLAKQKVLALLSGDKLPEVTTWADEMRSNPAEFWQKESGRWHYISVNEASDFKPESYAYPHFDKPKDLYSAILHTISHLQNDATNNKEFHLRFLTHLIGDLHMPLHVGRSEDRGGNRIRVKFFGKSVNLHSLWDTELIESQNLSYKDFADFIDTNEQTEISNILQGDVASWVRESHELSKVAYDIGDGEFRYEYQYQNLPIVKDQLLKAGIRLAGVLNLIFDANAKAGLNAIKAVK